MSMNRQSPDSPAPPLLWSLVIAITITLLAGCGGSIEGACWGTCPEPEPMDETQPVREAETPAIRVVDGDTLAFDGDRWRLQGFDAPENAQTCLDADGAEWACGRDATEALERLVSAGTVSCTDSGQRSYGRIVGSCSAGGVEFGAALVRDGHAVNDPRYAPDYADQEKTARDRGAGIHAGRYLAPWDWRDGERLGDAAPDFLVTHDTDIVLRGLLPPEGARGGVRQFDPEGIEDAMDATAWGAWSSGGAFAVVDPGGDGNVTGISWAPHFPATNPKQLDGAASWSGEMAGMDARGVGAVSGRAVITLEDFDDPSVDISFTGIRTRIRTLASDATVDDMEWRDLPVRSGSFSSDSAGSRIEGRFHGDRHQGAGGVFEHGSIVGAFGASRD